MSNFSCCCWFQLCQRYLIQKPDFFNIPDGVLEGGFMFLVSVIL